MTAPTSTRCRTLVGSFGVPGQRDLDVGRHLVAYLEPYRWPEGVVVEDLSFSAHLVLHRLQELRPAKLVLVGAVASGKARPGTVRRRFVPAVGADRGDPHEELAASLGGAVGLEHTLAVLSQWGGLPSETVVLEVEPADCGFGAGFSDALAASFDAILEAVQAEVGEADPPTIDPEPVTMPAAEPAAVPVSEALGQLRDFARRRREARDEDRHRGAPLPDVPGLEAAVRSRPWGMGLQGGSDWFDVVPLPGGWVVAVVGEVPGRGMEAVGAKADLAAAARASALLAGPAPARVVENLDRFVSSGGDDGKGATVACIALHVPSGDLRLCSAGHCPPVVVEEGAGRLLHEAFTEPLGGPGGHERGQLTARAGPGATVLLYSDGLVESPVRPLALGLIDLEEAVGRSSGTLDALCDGVLAACVNRHRREDDVTLLALRRSPYRGRHDRERHLSPPG